MTEVETLTLPAGLTPIGRAVIHDAVALAEHHARLCADGLARGVQEGGPTGFVISPTFEHVR